MSRRGSKAHGRRPHAFSSLLPISLRLNRRKPLFFGSGVRLALRSRSSRRMRNREDHRLGRRPRRLRRRVLGGLVSTGLASMACVDRLPSPATASTIVPRGFGSGRGSSGTTMAAGSSVGSAPAPERRRLPARQWLRPRPWPRSARAHRRGSASTSSIAGAWLPMPSPAARSSRRRRRAASVIGETGTQRSGDQPVRDPGRIARRPRRPGQPFADAARGTVLGLLQLPPSTGRPGTEAPPASSGFFSASRAFWNSRALDRGAGERQHAFRIGRPELR